MKKIIKNNRLKLIFKKFKKVIFAVIITVVVLSSINISGAPYPWNNTVTWTTKDDFENNAVSTGTATTNYLNLADTTTSSGNITLVKPNDNTKTIAAGNGYSLIVKNDGTAWASGDDDTTNFGLATPNHSDSFIQVASDISSVVAGFDFSFIIKRDGTLWGSGYNASAQLGLAGLASKTVFTDTNISNVKQVSAGYMHSLVLKNDGTLWGTGGGTLGQFGKGSASNLSTWTQLTNENIVSGVIDIAGGRTSSYVVKSDGTLWVTGQDTYGQLGLGDDLTQRNTWVQATTLSDVKEVDANGFDTVPSVLVLKNDGTVWGAGQNGMGDLGIGITTQVNTWTQSNISNVIDISVGNNFSLAIKSDGTLWSVGYGSDGALGNGNSISRTSWTYTGIDNVTEISAGYDHSIIRKTDGSTMVAGNNSLGTLGLSSDTIYSSEFIQQSINGTPVSVGSSGNTGTGLGSQFIVMSDGSLWGTGYNSRYNLGIGSNVTNRNGFISALTTNVKKVIARTDMAGLASSYILKNDGTVWAVGRNTYGQFGYGVKGGTTDVTSWRQSTISNVKDLVVALFHLVALKEDGTVWTVGRNNYGQIGNATTTDINTWYQVPDITNAVEIGASKNGASSYIVTSAGEIWSAGLNDYYQLGLGNNTNKSTFTKSTIISDVTKVWGGQYNVFCKKSDGTIWAVGLNTSGQLGVGDLVNKTTWTQLTDFTNATYIAPSNFSTFILKSDNTLWATGRNFYYEMATGINNTISTPVQVATGVTAMDINQYNSIIIKDGQVYTSGRNSVGELGIPLAEAGIHYSFENSLTNVKAPGGYYAIGTISGYMINASRISKWNTISWTATTPAGTSIKFRTRGAETEEELQNAEWSDYYTTSGSKITTANSKLLEIEMVLNSVDGLSSPTLEDFSINYYDDIVDPTNPDSIAAWTNSEKGKVIESGEGKYTNDSKPYFEFSGATDEAPGSEIKGYYIYFGSSNTADPYTAGVFQTQSSEDIQSFIPSTDLTSSGSYYLRIRTIDNADNISDIATIFEYNYDKTVPVSPNSINVTPFGWSRTNNFSFTFDSGFDEALYDSGLLGYQYKFGGTSTDWSGEVFTTNELSINDIEAYQDGQNIMYLRAVDNAGNTGIVRQVYFYYNGQAPSIPQNLTVNPQSSTTDNSFTFTWEEPESYNAEIKGYRYSINSLPQANNTIFINLSSLSPEVSYDQDTKKVTISNIPAATLQGFNYFYVVAVDTNDNVAYGDVSARIGFGCTTPAPGNPTNIEIFDTSNRDREKFSIALNWAEPVNKGVGFKHYVIEKSLDGEDFEFAGSSAGNSFIETELSSRKYYYRVLTEDNSGNTSIPSEIVNIIPTGRYTTPPTITVTPEVDAKVTTATVRWVTDREASSFVVANESMDFDATKNQQGQQDNEVEHVVKLIGLKPDTLYYYRVIYTDSDGNSNVATAENYQFRTLPAPRVEQVKTYDVRLTTAIISFYTSEPAQADLLYGKTTNYSSEIENISGGATTAHTIRIDSLDHSSTYHFAIRIKDMDDNEIISDDYFFDTLMFPKISNVRFEALKDRSTSTFKITWESNVPTNSIVKYTPDGGRTQEAVSSELKTTHEIIVSNLLDNKYYNFVVYGTDQYGNQAESEANRVKTDYDTRPPAISNITSEVSTSEIGVNSKGQVVISWETDELSTSQIEYGLGSTGDNYEMKSQEDSGLNTSHVIVINGLRPSSTYHFRVISKDGSENESKSEAQSIITEESREAVIDIIIKSLQDSIGWLFKVK